jgi:predicted exporter
VSLSAFTSLLAFGLLALSDTPVLHHFGLTVACGLTLVWLLAPLMRQN